MMKDFRKEVLANREYLKLIIGPWWNAKIDNYIDPSTRRSSRGRPHPCVNQDGDRTGMKRFTVPCDFAGIKYPFYVLRHKYRVARPPP